MDKKLYRRLYRSDPGGAESPVYVGGYYEKTGGMPANRFRLCGIGMLAAVTVLLALTGSAASGPGKPVYVALPYAFSYLPAVLGLFAFLQAPSDEGRIREDTWHNSLEKIRVYGVFGSLLCGISLIGGGISCILKQGLGLPELLFLTAAAVNSFVFAVVQQMRKKQTYAINT